jgi:hypothetical protein
MAFSTPVSQPIQAFANRSANKRPLASSLNRAQPDGRQGAGDRQQSPRLANITRRESTLPEGNLRLYADAQYASPYAMSVFVALHEKRLPFDLATVDLGRGANHDASYAAKSLTQRVPTLVHADFTLSESSAITEYLDEAFSETFVYPQDKYLRESAPGTSLASQRSDAHQAGAFHGGSLLRGARRTAYALGSGSGPEIVLCSRNLALRKRGQSLWKVVHRRHRSVVDAKSPHPEWRSGTDKTSGLRSVSMGETFRATMDRVRPSSSLNMLNALPGSPGT